MATLLLQLKSAALKMHCGKATSVDSANNMGTISHLFLMQCHTEG